MKMLAKMLLLAGVVVTAPAMAVVNTYDLGDVTGLLNAKGGFHVVVDDIEDYLFFSVSGASPAVLSSTIGSVLVDSPLGTLYDISPSLSVSLWKDLGASGVDGADMAVPGLSGTGLYVSESTSVVPGTYYLKLAGVATGLAGGGYSYAVVAIPVPEAETWAMMAMGLGLVGLQLRRRKSAERIA